MTIYIFDVLLSKFGTSLLFRAQFYLLLFTAIHISQEAGKVVSYSLILKNFPQHGFGVVNKAEVDVFLEHSCFFYDPTHVGNLISGFSAFSKSSLNIWNFRFMNHGKLEVVKQEMARVNIDILGISELKWTRIGEFNSDDHYIYYCGQESLRRKGVAIIVNKRVQNAILGCSLKNDRMISVHFQSKQFNITVIQVCALTSNAEEAEV